MAWDTVIGLEVHAQLKTKSKLFSGSNAEFGASPNSQTSFIDAGFPGVLPVLNEQALIFALQFGLAIHAKINNHTYFERKNYFYPDLPKGYQISQFQRPIVEQGVLTIELNDGKLKDIVIQRAHLEEDAGKSLHDSHPLFTGIDLNRAGTPLLEIVSAPCLYSAEEALLYLKALHRLVRFLGICDGNMQEGSFRCDVNISLKPQGAVQLGTRTELKNLNSFRFIHKAILHEQRRQQDLLERGKKVQQETRSYCPITDTTQVLRSKENENDYRYFPDPDLLPIEIPVSTLEKLARDLPPLPHEISKHLKENTALQEEDIQFLLISPAHYQFFQQLIYLSKAEEKTILNWLRGPLTAALNEANLDFSASPLAPKELAPLLDSLSAKRLSSHQAKLIFTKLWAGDANAEELIQQFGSNQQDEATLEEQIKALISQYPQQATEYKAGKEKLLSFFVGQMMKQTKGQADPELIGVLVKKILQEL